MKSILATEFPEFAEELARLLRHIGEGELAETVPRLPIVERCRCGDDFCATLDTAPPPADSWGRSHRNVALDPERGILVLDVLDQQIVCIEALFRDEIREHLLKLFP